MTLYELIEVLEGFLDHYGARVDVPVYILDNLRGGEVHEVEFSDQLWFDERNKKFYIRTASPEDHFS